VQHINAAFQKTSHELRLDPQERTLWMLEERRALESMTAYLDRFIPPEADPSV